MLSLKKDKLIEEEVVKYMNLVKRDSEGMMSIDDFGLLVERVY